MKPDCFALFKVFAVTYTFREKVQLTLNRVSIMTHSYKSVICLNRQIFEQTEYASMLTYILFYVSLILFHLV